MRNPRTTSTKQLAAALDKLRLDRRLSYRELGEQVGLPEPTIRKFIKEAGERGFHDTTVHPIREFLESERHSA